MKFFFNSRLKIRLDQQASIGDAEPFALDALEKWNVRSILAADFLRRKEPDCRELNARGLLPHGGLGAFALTQIREASRPLLTRLEEYRAVAPESRTVELFFPEDYCLAGKIANCYPGKGLLHFTPSKFKGSHLLALWLDHLCLSAAGGTGQAPSRLYCADRCWQFSALESGRALDLLWKTLLQFLDALQCPPAIFPQASYAWASCHLGGKPSEEALNKARQKWEGHAGAEIPGEKDDPYLQIVLRDVDTDPLGDPEFARCSLEFYRDALQFAEAL